MSFLHSNEIIVDAVLTKRGRQLLSENSPDFKITKFALSDDGVDYRLYNPDHPSGSNYYGEAIENTPMLEAIVDDTMTMKYKLVTLDKGTLSLAIVSATPSSLTSLKYKQTADIIPSTSNTYAVNSDIIEGYTCILDNKQLASIEVIEAARGEAVIPSWMNTDELLQTSISAVGAKFRIRAKDVTSLSTAERTGRIIIVGNESGGTVEIPISVVPPTVTTS